MMILIVVKFVLAVTVVLVLSAVAENVSVKWAGILSGVPSGSAISLYFFSLENGLEFVKESALYNMLGLAATIAGLACYYLAGSRARRHTLACAVTAMVVVFFGVSLLLNRLPASPLLAAGLPVTAILLFRHFGKAIPDSGIDTKVRQTLGLLLFRVVVAAGIILAVTGTAYLVGPKWAGLFSAFPATVLPLVLIMHINYDARRAYTAIKYVPDGLGSLVVYSFILYLAYPHVSLYAGLGLAYAGVAVYLACYTLIRRRKAP